MTDPDHIYYDLDIVNSAPSDLSLRNYPLSNRLNFTEVRSSPILLNPSDYYLSIVRFELDTANSLPAFIPQIILDQSNTGPDFPNLTTYSITFGVAGAPNYFVKQRVVYQPQYTPSYPTNSGIPQAPTSTPITLEQATSNYYWVSDFKNFIAMINKALSDAWAVVLATSPIPVPASNANASCAPFLVWDTDTQLCSLYAPQLSFQMGDNVAVDGAPVQLYFNTSLYTLFSSFQANFLGSIIDTTDPNEDETNYRIRIYGDHNRNILAPSGPTGFLFPPFNDAGGPPVPQNAIKMVQSFQTGATMCPVSQVIFNTSLIPCATTLIGIPRITNGFGGLGSQQQTQNDNFANQITDLVVNISNGYEYLPAILYEPTAQYRYIDLQSNTPLYGVQITVGWKDVYGITHDFYLSDNQGTSMKILFCKKETAL
jgi:hypothetical protein